MLCHILANIIVSNITDNFKAQTKDNQGNAVFDLDQVLQGYHILYHGRNHDFFRGGEHFFKKYSKNIQKNFQKISNRFQKNDKKIFLRKFLKMDYFTLFFKKI